jgi:isopenicillin N synthase-like dioxygenase
MAISNGDIVQIPVINISEPNESVGDALIDAASKHGFIYVESKGTGFTAEYVDRAFELSKLFFDSPREEKAGCMITEDNKGWSAMHSEILDPEHQRVWLQFHFLMRLAMKTNQLDSLETSKSAHSPSSLLLGHSTVADPTRPGHSTWESS